MDNFTILYRYELKKILMCKRMWITFTVCILTIGTFAAARLTGTYYVDGKAVDTHYHMYQVDMEYRRALSGRAVAQKLLEEMAAAYGRVPVHAERYTLTEEYQTYARPYSEIFGLVWDWTGENPFYGKWKADEESLYAARDRLLEEQWRTLFLTEEEKAFWREKEAQTAKPFTYWYHDGYRTMLDGFETAGLLALLFTSICLCGVFTEEHTRRTDQLLLSSAKGQDIAYWAKICAGASVSAVCALGMALTAAAGAFYFYGAEGFWSVIQMDFAEYSYPMTAGQACLLDNGILVVTAAFAGVLVMVGSEALHNSIATLAVSMGFIIAGWMFRIPNQYRQISQLWQSMPMCFLSNRGIFDLRLVNVAGHYFTVWQVVPLVYVVLGVLLAVGGKRVYRRYQVSGR